MFRRNFIQNGWRQKIGEIQEKLQKTIGNIIADIAKTDEGLKRLQIMHQNNEIRKTDQDKIE